MFTSTVHNNKAEQHPEQTGENTGSPDLSFRCRTVALETGMQNTQLCSTIVQLSFTPEELNLIFTFPLIYSIFQIIAAALFLAGEGHSQSPFMLTRFEESWSCQYGIF